MIDPCSGRSLSLEQYVSDEGLMDQEIDSGAINTMNLDQLVLYGVNSARDVGIGMGYESSLMKWLHM